MAGHRPERDGQWVGFLNYDLGRLFERLPARAVDDLGTPLFAFALVDKAAAETPADADAPWAAELLDSNFTREAYERAVARVVEYVAAGDAFQVNLSQRFTARCWATAQQIYRRLQRQSPACYGACLDFRDFALVSNSPELFLKVGAWAGTQNIWISTSGRTVFNLTEVEGNEPPP